MYDPARTHSGQCGLIGNLPAGKWANEAKKSNELNEFGKMLAARGNQEEVQDMSDEAKIERAIKHDIRMSDIKRSADRKEKAEEAFGELERYWYKFCQFALCLAGIGGVYVAFRLMSATWALL